MADEIAKSTQYQYTANSNLVLQADRSALPRRDQEPSGEPETLWGRIDPKQMGSRAIRDLTVIESLKANQKKSIARGTSRKSTQQSGLVSGSGALAVLSAVEDFSGLNYRPLTKETLQVYEVLLSFVQSQIGDGPQELIRDAADEVITVLKDTNLRDFDRKEAISSVIGELSSEEFAQIVNLGKRLVDYGKDTGEGENEDGKDIEDEAGVAVIFDESEDEEELPDGADFEEQDQEMDEDEDEDDTMSATEFGEAYQERSKQTVPLEEREKLNEKTRISDDEEEGFRTTIPSSSVAPNASGVMSILPSSGRPVYRPAPATSAPIGSSLAMKKHGMENGRRGNVLSPREVDAFWLQRKMAQFYTDPITAQDKTARALDILSSASGARDCENSLMELFEHENFDLVKILTKNQQVILWRTRLGRANAEEKSIIAKKVTELGLGWILDDWASESRSLEDSGEHNAKMDIESHIPQRAEDVVMKDTEKENVDSDSNVLVPQQILDLELLSFNSGNHQMSNRRVKLPEGSTKKTRKGYEEIQIPALHPGKKAPQRLVPFSQLPKWCQTVFQTAEYKAKNVTTFNEVQSKVFSTAFNSDENILLCAPTGAGKTNIALLTILNQIAQYRDSETGTIDTDNFKVVYVSPMKALVQEQVRSFSTALDHLGIQVKELTGDRQLTKSQIMETQIIVTTPEKWDVITRKGMDRSYTALVRLLIVDEIHLLHDDRGPVLESIISRTVRKVEQTRESIRLIGLSATLPNYKDVAAFLRVDINKGLFFFDGSYRPVPLSQQYIGVTEKKALKRFQVMNQITYEKVIERAGQHQTLIFVHSRKETAKTAKMIRDLAIESETISRFVKEGSASRAVLQDATSQDSTAVKNTDLRDLLPYGFAIHHAGMTGSDRETVEELFRERHVQVLVSTATLAWGVNLPAHTVIIKGTQIYNPEKGRWVELSPQDVLQMFGRAGRPLQDTKGEGILITSQTEVQYYLSLLNQQLPIESQLISRLPDHLNAEIVLGNIQDREDAARWLSYTYLFIRMLRNPSVYQVSGTEIQSDHFLKQRRVDLIHTAASLLDRCNLIKYDRKSGKFQVNELGRIASHYYISHKSMAIYNQHLNPRLGQVDLFRVFALSEEFKYIPVREEEKLELAKILERVPIPIKEGSEDPVAKVNALLQAYIAGLRLEGFALMSDMIYVTQSAVRILRALFEICLKRGWAQLSFQLLDMCKMVEKRQSLSMSPLRQFTHTSSMEFIRRLEKKDFPWDRYYDLSPQELGELVGVPKLGKALHKLVHQIPRVILQAHVQPVTRSLLKIELSITPDFQYDYKRVHGGAETFWIIVTDVDDEVVLYHDIFYIKAQYAEEEHYVTMTVPIFEPLAPIYYVYVVSDRWLHSETRLPVSFKHLILPDKYPPHTELLDLQPLPTSALKNAEFEALFQRYVRQFNPIQTQVFNQLYLSDDNVFIGAPPGSGKTICAEFAILRLWGHQSRARVVYVAPHKEVCQNRLIEWRAKFSKILGGKNIVMLGGDTASDLRLLEKGDLILCTPAHFDMLSRRWKKRKTVQTIGLFICDDLHLIGGPSGPVYEVIASRMRYIAAQTDNKSRIVALSTSLANAKDLGEWLGCKPHTIFNFHPNVRPTPLEIHIQGYNIPSFASMMMAMTKASFTAVKQFLRSPEAQQVLIFVPNRKQSRMTAAELIMHAAASDNDIFTKGKHGKTTEQLATYDKLLQRVEDRMLRQDMIPNGVAFFHEALVATDKQIVQELFTLGFIRALVASRDTVWQLIVQAHMIIIMGTQTYEGKEHRYIDYTVADVLEMLGKASYASAKDGEEGQAQCVFMCPAIKRDFYKKFLYEALPVESHLDHALHDHLNAEIVTKTIENKQDAVDYLTWTFFYRRLSQNPNYYALQGTSHRHLSDHLSELVEDTINDLVKTKSVAVEDDDIELSALNLGMVAAYYYVSTITIDMFSLSLTAGTKIRGLLEILSNAVEFERVPIRHKEDMVLSRLYNRIPIKFLDRKKFHDPHVKTNILLQAHFSRIQLPIELESDQHEVVEKVMPIIRAMVDVISSHGWLGPALHAMELSQMCVQAVWERDSPLKQIPHMNAERIEKFKAVQVSSVFDVMEMEDDVREKVLEGIPQDEVGDMARFVNNYPNIEVVTHLAETKLHGGQLAKVEISLLREAQEDEEDTATAGVDTRVTAPYFPVEKEEGWWLVIGDPKTKTLCSIKRITLEQRLSIAMDFAVPNKVGKYSYTLYVMCDAYIGCDQVFDIKFEVASEKRDDKPDTSDDDDSDESTDDKMDTKQ